MASNSQILCLNSSNYSQWVEVSQLQLEKSGSWGVIDGTIPQFENSNRTQQPVVAPPIVCNAPKKPDIEPFVEPAFVPSSEAESDVQKLQLERIEHEANVNELREQHSKLGVRLWNSAITLAPRPGSSSTKQRSRRFLSTKCIHWRRVPLLQC